MSFLRRATIDGCRAYGLIALSLLIVFLLLQIQDLFALLFGG
jgi:hypothetical protein